eukprot:SAG11_NODE_794_length_7137_cov_45.288576_2_plen_159_part_00
MTVLSHATLLTQITFERMPGADQDLTVETHDLVTAALFNFRTLVADQRHLEDDSFCLRFLRRKRFDMEQAAAVCTKYWEFHDATFPESAEFPAARYRSVPGMWRTLQHGFLHQLPGRDNSGRKIMLVLPMNVHPSEFSPVEMAGVFTHSEKILKDSSK